MIGSYYLAQEAAWATWLFNMPSSWAGVSLLSVSTFRCKKRALAIDNIDTGEEKKQLCKSLGADYWIDFKESKDIVRDIKAATDGLGAHSAIVTAASSAAYSQAVDYLRPGGTLMVVGMPGQATLDASIFFTVYKVSVSLTKSD